MFGLLNNPPGCSPILLMRGFLASAKNRGRQQFEWN
jgi:hypothetical protein